MDAGHCAADTRITPAYTSAMALTCNIDARGKVVRLIYGMVLLLTAAVLIWFWALPGDSVLVWIITVLIAISGAFAVFEGWAGWCVMRAMGFRTPM